MFSVSISIRGTFLAFAAGSLCLGLPMLATAQAAPQKTQPAAPANSGNAPQATASDSAQASTSSESLSQPLSEPLADQPDESQPDQPQSLGDLARVARANKANAPKAAKVFDDENLPRNGGGISVVGNDSGASGDSSSGGGKMKLLDFWASWCGPCRKSIPDLKDLQRAYSSDQLEVVSVNEDKNENAGRSFASENGMTWDVEYDPQGQTSREYGVSAIPTFILMDGSGREVQRFVGEDPGQPLAQRIAPYMAKTSKAAGL
jgi:thiol-disulfide isomerase/thioredoxin